MREGLALAALLLGALAPAAALAPECAALPGEEGRACKSVETAIDVGAPLCRFATGARSCDAIDGEPVSSAAIDAYLASPTHAAMGARFHADDALPMKLARWPSTHNSYNAEVYAPTLSGLDANQRYSILDQLRMDMRSVELDVHWWPNADGLGFAPVMCHAEAAGNGIHAGCTNERLFAAGLNEIAYFLRQDEAADEVVLLYVEDHLDAKPEAYAAAAASLGAMRDAILAPADMGRGCEDGLPLDMSRDDVRALGRRLLVVASTCGPADGPWAGLVHSYHASVDQHGVENLTPWPDCGGPGVAYAEKIVRFWEDATWLTYMNEPQLALTPEVAREMIRCGVNMPGLDMLAPEDGRLDALASP